jgi:Tol biopolymer transport system component
MASAVTPAAVHSPVCWSPDGRWLACTLVTRDDLGPLTPGWLFRTSEGAAARRSPGRSIQTARSYRLYAIEVGTGGSVLIASSPDPLTAPGWRQDGGALAYGRLLPGRVGPSRLEIVIKEGVQQRKSLATYVVAESLCEASLLPSMAPVWSPDGRYLAVPGPQPSAFLVLRADNGQVMKSVENGSWPSWSPDGSRLAYVRNGGGDTLQVIEGGFGPSRQVAELGQTFQPPLWSRDGKSVLTVSRRSMQRGPTPFWLTELVRVQIDSGTVESTARLSTDAFGRDHKSPTTSYSLAQDRDDLFYANDVEGQPSTVVWFRPRSGETFNRFHPVDFVLRLGGLALSPGGKVLALRFGSPGPGMPAGLWDSGSMRFSPLVPDDACRVEWLRLLIESTMPLLRGAMPAAAVQGRAVERATVLPIPGEIPQNQELAVRLRQIGRIGRPLCDRPVGAAPGDPAVDVFLDEARLFFDYLRDDFPAALTALEALEGHTATPDHLLRLLSLRGQIFLGMGEPERAIDVVTYLLGQDQRRPRQLETTPAGFAWAETPAQDSGWPSYLNQRLQDRRKARASSTEASDDPLRNRNLEVPGIAPGLVVPFDRRADGLRQFDVIPFQRQGGERFPPPPPPFVPDERLRFQHQPIAPR